MQISSTAVLLQYVMVYTFVAGRRPTAIFELIFLLAVVKRTSAWNGALFFIGCSTKFISRIKNMNITYRFCEQEMLTYITISNYSDEFPAATYYKFCIIRRRSSFYNS